MKNNIRKFFLIMVIGLIINLIIKFMLFNHVPNSISSEEIKHMQLLGLQPSLYSFSFRWVPKLLTILIILLSSLLVYIKTKKILLSIITLIILSFSPWLFIIGQVLNLYLFLLLIIILLLVTFGQKKYWVLTTLFLFILFKQWLDLNLPNSQQIVDTIPSVFRLLDFKTLFFSGDSVSQYLKIPKTGYFLFFDLIPLFVGIYVLLTIQNNKSIGKIISELFIIGLCFFFISQSSSLNIYRGIIIFYSVSLVIAVGYEHLIHRANYLFKALIVIIFIFNVFFTYELFYYHFDKKNSFEWGYAEVNAINQLNNKQIKCINITQESGKLKQYVDFFSKDVKFKTNLISNSKLENVCYAKNNCYCLLREQELEMLGLQKDDIKTIFSHYEGLPVYFLIDKP